MSGIAGAYYLDSRPADQEGLGRMLAVLAHRGPDGAAIWCEGAVCLGHRMLHTTPESYHEHQPLIHPEADLVLTADVRLDNRDELLRQLVVRPRRGSIITDAELILASYMRWGTACPEHLLGDFAFAIWDARAQHLFCARDPFGVRSFLYYHLPGRLFAFASEIKALRCRSDIPCDVNELKVAGYLVGQPLNANTTFYEHILRLPPAHSLTVTSNGLRMWQYWSPDPSRQIRFDSDRAYEEAFREVFDGAVACRMPSAYPVGTTLSGGLGSSPIACLARQRLVHDDERLPTFSVIFESVPESNDRPYIDAVVEQGGIEPHFVHGDHESMLAGLDDLLWFLEEPFHSPHLIFSWRFYRIAQQQGVRVM